MECFSAAYLFLHGVTDTCSFLDAPFFLQQRCFFCFFLGGGIPLILSVILFTDPMFKPWGVYNEFCLVEVLQPNTNLLIGTYIPIVAVNFLLGQGPVEWKLLVMPSNNGYCQGYQRCV